MARVPANVPGDLVRVALMEARPAGLTTLDRGELLVYERGRVCDELSRTTDAEWELLPHFQTVYGFFARWAKNGVLEHIRDQLRRRIRVDAGRCPRPVTAIMDSQSVKAAETVSRDTRGFDGAKLINGRKGT